MKLAFDVGAEADCGKKRLFFIWYRGFDFSFGFACRIHLVLILYPVTPNPFSYRLEPPSYIPSALVEQADFLVSD